MPARNIAVVDDEALVGSATASLLRSYGYHAMTFDCAHDFLARADRSFDCLVSDVQMPAMSGLDLYRQLRAEGASVPVVLMTAYPTASVRSFVAESDVIALLEKPLVSEDLIAAIERALDAK
ncbi:MAG: response regulator [Sphingomonas sp.]|uniref:response regulator transcription factor n=1 Tax=Sphingomonas sp. TaxID=28214 RepID=UPI001B19DA17|nr:response regulator [Sphingomonas sp.]MBO9621235.1 response regulator [Sphingomonas sp.]